MNECLFCKDHEKLKVMETTIYQVGCSEQRKVKAGLGLQFTTILSFKNGEEFSTKQYQLKGTYNLNYCPECGRKLNDEQIQTRANS